MRMEAASPAGAMASAAGVEGDSPMSTHPAAANRLRRLAQLYS